MSPFEAGVAALGCTIFIGMMLMMLIDTDEES